MQKSQLAKCNKMKDVLRRLFGMIHVGISRGILTEYALSTDGMPAPHV